MKKQPKRTTTNSRTSRTSLARGDIYARVAPGARLRLSGLRTSRHDTSSVEHFLETVWAKYAVPVNLIALQGLTDDIDFGSPVGELESALSLNSDVKGFDTSQRDPPDELERADNTAFRQQSVQYMSNYEQCNNR